MTTALRLQVVVLCVILACGRVSAQQVDGSQAPGGSEAGRGSEGGGGSPAGGGAQAWGLNALMRDLGAVQHSKARFVERKYLKILDRPLELSGTLEYRAPDHLARRTLTPKPESFVVDGDRLRLEDARGRKRSFALQDHPMLWAFVESIRSTLKGDQAQLERFYNVALDGSEQAWRLSLTPKQPRMSALIARIVIAGGGGRIATVEIHETQGDHSIMTVIEADP